MNELAERLRNWARVSEETKALLQHTDELMEQRAALLRSVRQELRDVLRLARDFTDGAGGAGGGKNQEPEARSRSLLSR